MTATASNPQELTSDPTGVAVFWVLIALFVFVVLLETVRSIHIRRTRRAVDARIAVAERRERILRMRTERHERLETLSGGIHAPIEDLIATVHRVTQDEWERAGAQ